MARNLELALTLAAKDTASKVLKKAMQDTIAQTKAVEKADDQLGKSQKQNSDSAIQASKALRSEYQRSASARSTLGIRAERDIQREIQLTQAAYNRLTRAGVMSANEQSRAFEAMTSRVSRLRGELNSAGQSMSRLERAKGWGSNAMAIAGGVTAAGMVIKDPVQRQMAWTQGNAGMVNTGFNELTPDQRIAKMPEINNAIQKSVREGGGTPEQAQDALGSILSAGLVDADTAMKMLPSIMKYSTASGADPKVLAELGTAAMANFGISIKDLPEFFDKSIRSGENGSFELPDMAGKMPTIMASARKNGMSGMKDYELLLAMLQANKLTTGDSSQAATNVDNLLNKYTSADTQNALKNYKFRGANGKALAYPDYIAEERVKGVSAPEAFLKGVNAIVSSDPRVKKLRAQVNKYQGTDKENDYKAALGLIIASITSKIIADAQAGAALNTNIQQSDFIKKQQQGTANATGAGEASYKVIASTPGFKSEQLESEKFFASLNAMEPLSNIYGDLATKLTDYAKEYPGLTTSVSGATTGIKAMGAAAAAFAGLKFLSGGFSKATPEVPVGGIKVPGTLGRMLGGFGRIAGRVAAPLALYQASQDAPLVQVERGDKEARDRLKVGNYPDGLSRQLDGIKAQPGLLDVLDELQSWWSKPSTIGAGSNGSGLPSYLQAPTQQAPFLPIQIHNTLTLDGKVVAESTNEVNATQANRGSTGGY